MGIETSMNSSIQRFKEKVVIITGAAGGLGSKIARTFISEGAYTILVDSSEKLFDIFHHKNDQFPKTQLVMKADLTDINDIINIVETTDKTWGKIDVLVNTAGVNIRKKIDQYTEEEFDWIYNVNVKSIFRLSNQVASIMKRARYGRIINFSSIQGVTCWNGKGAFSLAPYSASKSAVIALTKAFALDLAKYQINVNAICPAFVNTELVRPVKEDKVLYKDIIARTPLGRFAEPKEIVGPVLFLASDESSFITGHSLLVDGGWTIE